MEPARVSGGKGRRRGQGPIVNVRKDTSMSSGIKLFDGKQTTREVLFQKALKFIMELSKEDEPAYLIAEAAIDAAGEVSYRTEKAHKHLTDTVEAVKEEDDNDGGEEDKELVTA